MTNPISEPSDELVLKPCPWCGGAAKLYQDWIYGTDKRDPNGWFVRCDPCDLTPDVAWSQPSAEAAVKGWNTRAAIAAMPELTVQGWQPIETAPRDGRRVLLWIYPTNIAMPFAWDGERWMGDDFPLNMSWATHWMPLPEPPVESSNG